jgi:hypothetical protein
MSKINVNTWEPESGTAATLMASGDTVTVPSGAALTIASGATITNSGTATGFGGDNTPSFLAFVDTPQVVSDNVQEKVEFDAELWDTDNAFDSTTNYRFTVPSGEGGKYQLFGQLFASAASLCMSYGEIKLQVNGTDRWASSLFIGTDAARYWMWPFSLALDLSASDYVEILANTDTSGADWTLTAGGSYSGGTWYLRTYFGGYKLLGV